MVRTQLQAETLEVTSDPVTTSPKAGVRSATTLLAEIRTFLRTGEVHDAQRLAAEASAVHPEDPDLRRMHELLNVGQARRRPGTGRSVRQEVEWLRDPPEELRGKWIAVQGRNLVASADSLNELMDRVPPHQEPQPLVLQIEA